MEYQLRFCLSKQYNLDVTKQKIEILEYDQSNSKRMIRILTIESRGEKRTAIGALFYVQTPRNPSQA